MISILSPIMIVSPTLRDRTSMFFVLKHRQEFPLLGGLSYQECPLNCAFPQALNVSFFHSVHPLLQSSETGLGNDSTHLVTPRVNTRNTHILVSRGTNQRNPAILGHENVHFLIWAIHTGSFLPGPGLQQTGSMEIHEPSTAHIPANHIRSGIFFFLLGLSLFEFQEWRFSAPCLLLLACLCWSIGLCFRSHLP